MGLFSKAIFVIGLLALLATTSLNMWYSVYGLGYGSPAFWLLMMAMTLGFSVALFALDFRKGAFLFLSLIAESSIIANYKETLKTLPPLGTLLILLAAFAIIYLLVTQIRKKK